MAATGPELREPGGFFERTKRRTRHRLLPERTPGGEFPPAQQCFRGPRPEIHRKSHTVSGVRSEHDRVFTLRMRHEDRAPVPAEKNGAAPPVRDLDFAQLGMQIVNPPFDRLEEISRVACRDVNLPEIARIVRIHQTSAKHDASVAATTAPQVRQIDRVEGISAGKADGFEPLFIHWLGENCERKLRLGAPREGCEFERQSIGGEKDFPGRASRAACVKNGTSDSTNARALLPLDLRDRAAFDDCDAAFICSAGESCHEFPGSSVPPGTFFTTRKFPESFH